MALESQTADASNSTSSTTKTPKQTAPWWAALLVFPLVLVAAIACACFAFWKAEDLRYKIAMRRIDIERDREKDAQQTERLRIEKAGTLAAVQSPVSNLALGAGAAGFTLLRELIANSAPAPGSGAGQSNKRSTSAIAGMVDALVSAGQITAGEAKSLKDELQSVGVEIGVDAAKALIDRFIKVQHKPAAAGEKSGPTFAGTTQVNMYCNVPPVRVAPPPTTPSAPKKTCS